MPYSLAIGSLTVIPESALMKRACTCSELQKGCTPSFVFSVAGQVAFRGALTHLTECRKKHCSSIRKQVKDAMLYKLRWLLQEEALLGCLEAQAVLYTGKGVADVRQQKHFMPVAHHLSQCPNESCARLRRALLLTVRDAVSPNAKAKVFE